MSAAGRERAFAAWLRHSLGVAALRQGGWPLPPTFGDRLRDLALALMGIGSASLHVRDSGESRFLDALAERWSARPRVTVIDVGAHAGAYAVAARAAFGSRARIHCFEPNPSLFASLRPRLSGHPEIVCHELALGDESGQASLFLDAPGSSRGSLVADTFAHTGTEISISHEVRVDTLDEVAAELGVEHVDLLKVDVQGHELAVLRGAETLLGRGAIDAVQFGFGERNLSARSCLRDFVDLLGPRFELYRLTPRGMVRFAYRPKAEIFALATNYVALAASR